MCSWLSYREATDIPTGDIPYWWKGSTRGGRGYEGVGGGGRGGDSRTQIINGIRVSPTEVNDNFTFICPELNSTQLNSQSDVNLRPQSLSVSNGQCAVEDSHCRRADSPPRELREAPICVCRSACTERRGGFPWFRACLRANLSSGD